MFSPFVYKIILSLLNLSVVSTSTTPASTTVAVLGNSCLLHSDCSAVGNAFCSTLENGRTGTCICNTGFKDDGSGFCVPKGLGDDCIFDDDCAAIANALCLIGFSNTCECNLGFRDNGSGNCNTTTQLGDSCFLNEDCSISVPNSQCGTDGIGNCICASGYTNVDGNCVTAFTCKTLESPENGNVSVTGLTAIFSCDPGFNLIGNDATVCLAEGTWSNPTPTCELACAALVAPENGNVLVSGVTRTFTCDPGFDLIGNDATVCLAEGTWSNPAPTCELACAALEVPENGNASVTGLTGIFSCDPGFNLIGNDATVCLAEGTWNNPTPTCELACAALLAPENGNFSVTGLTGIFSCDPGFNLIGNDTTVCLAGGTWSNPAPTCELACAQLTDHENGFVLVLGAFAIYVCIPPFWMSDINSIRQCSDRGEWVPPTAPTCELACSSPTQPLNGNVTIIGATALFTCESGFLLNGSRDFINITCNTNGTWNDSAPTCDLACTPHTDPLNGEVKTVAATETFSCNSEFILNGKSTITCNINGTWSGEAPTCDLACTAPTEPANGKVNIMNTTAYFDCNSGFNLNGPTTINCTTDLTWSGDAPTCILACSSPTQPLNGHVAIIGATARFTCESGFLLNGSREFINITCNTNGTWNDHTPTCDVACTPHTDPLNGEVKIVAATETFSCNSEFILNGESTITCNTNGTWSGKVPTCELACTAPTEPANGKVSIVNATAYFDCNSGFNLNGPTTINCTTDLTWSRDGPTCDFACEDLIDPVNGQARRSGALVNFTCSLGYMLVGTETAECQTNGSWTGDAPICELLFCTSGYQLVDDVCVECPMNSYKDETMNVNSTCALCPPGFITGRTGATSIDECNIDDCPSGNEYDSDIGDCKPCQIGYYRDIDARTQIHCQLCEPSFITSEEGAVSPTQCNIANCTTPGTYRQSDNTCQPCPIGEYASDRWLTSCTPCPEGSFTQDVGSTDVSECISCPTLTAPENGAVNATTGSLDESVTFTCISGFSLVGEPIITCLRDGTWNNPPSECVFDPVICPRVKDDEFNITWMETLANRTISLNICPLGFEGTVSKHCSVEGDWLDTRNQCIRQEIQNIEMQMDQINDDEIPEVVSDVLRELNGITNTTESAQLNDGEIETISTILTQIANISVQDTVSTRQTEDFLENVSNLLDDANVNTWNKIKSNTDTGAEIVLQSTETFVSTYAATIEKAKISRKNLEVEISAVPDDTDNLFFPGLAGDDSVTELTNSATGFFLSKTAIEGLNITKAVTILYKNPESVSTKIQSNEKGQKDEVKVNAEILSVSLFPKPDFLLSPLQLNFIHLNTSLVNPACSFWRVTGSEGQGSWSTEGCWKVHSNSTMTECACTHLTNFAILMSPFLKDNINTSAIRIVSIIGISISTLGLIITLASHLWLWRYMRSDRTRLLLCLCGAMVVAYLVFLAGVDRVENKVICAIVAALLQYIYLVVFCLMLAQGIEIAITVLYVFNKKSRLKLYLWLSFLTPAVIVGVSLGVVKAEGYGTENFCWLSVDSGLIWAFVGPAVFIIIVNAINLFLVMKAMFGTKAMVEKSKKEKVQAGVRSLCILIPTMGLTWVFGILNINATATWMPYVFSVCNGLQGFTIFVFHCVLNQQLRRAWRQREVRRLSTTLKTSMQKSGSRYSEQDVLPNSLEKTASDVSRLQNENGEHSRKNSSEGRRNSNY